MNPLPCRAAGMLACAGALATAGCGRSAKPANAEATRPDVPLITADTTTVAVPLALPGQLYVEHDAIVYARTSGVVESIYVDIGSPVEAGQLLAQLENTDQAIALAQAEEQLANTRRVVERQRDLAKSRSISSADSEVAEFEFQRATLARRQAQRNYDLTRVVAPFAGAVTARTVRPGRLLAVGDTLFRVTAQRPLRVSVHVPEASGGGLQVGSSGRVEGLDGTTVAAGVIRASPLIDAASGTREFVLQLTDSSRLRPGASVTVHVGAERRRVLAVPLDVIAEQGYVLVWENGRTMLRAVTVGATLADGRLEIVSGLAPGEQVIRNAPPPSPPSRPR